MKTQHDMLQSERVICRASMALKFVDDYTGETPLGSITAVIEDFKIKAVRNPSGYYIFSDLKPGTYKIRINTSYYLYEERWVTVKDENNGPELLIVNLIPNTAYPFENGATLVRTCVMDKYGEPLKDAVIKVYVLPVNNAGNSIGTISSVSGNMLEIKLLSSIYAAQKDNILKTGVLESEEFRVTECSEKSGNMQKVILDSAPKPESIDKPVCLTADSRIDTRTNDKGEAVFYFRNIKEKRFFIKVQVIYTDKNFIINGGNAAQDKLEVAENSEIKVDIIEK